MRPKRLQLLRVLGSICGLIVSIALVASSTPTSAAPPHPLRREPYLTDLLQRHVVVNWATTPSVSKAWVRYGKARSGSCTTRRVEALRKTIVVGTTQEYQWRASLDRLNPNTRYCYRIYGDGVGLLGHERAPRFLTQVKHGSTAPFSFAVLGDWGAVDANGQNPDQAAVLQQIAQSPARFAVSTGDTGYPSGSQRNYGDLVQSGADTSGVFGPAFWASAGASIAMFNAQGNHGMNETGLINWPQPRAVSSSDGRYRMHRYCCVNGTTPGRYPSAWYAFDAGRARFYVLQAAWPNTNVGTADVYRNDYDAHWTTSSAEMRWLRHDLRTHHSPVSFAFFHFPLYADTVTEGSDPWLHGADHLEDLLGKHGVDVVFNGHAHIYERNAPSALGMPVSYVTGGGGAKLQPVSQCGPLDRYAIGWAYRAHTHGSACGAAPVPSSIDRVFHFLLVRVHGRSVTVTPTDEAGRSFDVQRYRF